MENTNVTLEKQKRSMYILAMINVGIWAVSVIGMVFLIQDAPNVKMLFPILGGGISVGVVLISTISKLK
jgi:hypothetical protein